MTDQPRIVDAAEADTAVVRGVVPLAELSGFFDSSFRKLPAAITAQGVQLTGPAFALYRGFSPERVDLEAGFTTDRAVEPVDGVVPASLPGGRVATLTHAGGFDGLSVSWERLRGWIEAEGLRPGAVFWEVYVTQPTPDMDPADLRTELNWPVAG